MPRRTDRVSERDYEVLDLIARLGVAPRSVVMAWAKTERTSSYRRERRLIDAGYVEKHPAFMDRGPVLAVTRRGLHATGRLDLREPRVSHALVAHSLESGMVGVAYEQAGHPVLFERELIAAERAHGERLYSAELKGRRWHRPDLILVGAEPIAIEVELTQKAAPRLDAILRAWRQAVLLKRVRQVVYRFAPQVRMPLERAMARTKITDGKHVRLEPLHPSPQLMIEAAITDAGGTKSKAGAS